MHYYITLIYTDSQVLIGRIHDSLSTHHRILRYSKHHMINTAVALEIQTWELKWKNVR
jgi:hypothetical protein